MKRHQKFYWLLLCIATALPLLAGIVFPMITDEAYYIDWARRSGWPRLGFFDHPPMVSWLAGLTIFDHSIIAARFMVWIAHLVSLYFVWKTTRILNPDRAFFATLLIASTIGAVGSGFILTPDAGMLALWSVAIHESVLAIKGQHKRWLTAGLVTGLGLWSKYTMVLIGPVFLWGMLRDHRKQLCTPWPYLGGLVCALVFTPHVWWQSQNDWVTFRFQFGHGFSITQNIESKSLLPLAQDPQPDDFDSRRLQDELFKAMGHVPGFSETIKPPKPDKPQWERAIQYLGDFLGGVAGLWGIYAIAFLLYLLLGRPRLHRTKQPSAGRPAGMGIIEAGAFFPLIFFGLISPFSKIEANWPAMHMTALAIWISYRWVCPLRLTVAAVTTHSLAVLALFFVIKNPEQFSGARNNRILLESKGFKELGQWATSEFFHNAIAVDSYQLKSALSYHAPTLKIAQWPGLTRGSEYTRGDDDDTAIEKLLFNQESISIITLKPKPKVIDGFTPESFRGIRICPDGKLGVFNVTTPTLPCQEGLRELWVTTYRNQNPR
jgi:hypothetical protein